MHTHCQENVLWFGLGANQEPPLYKVHQIYIRNKESYFKKCAHEATSCKGQIAVLTDNLQHVVHIHAKRKCIIQEGNHGMTWNRNGSDFIFVQKQ